MEGGGRGGNGKESRSRRRGDERDGRTPPPPTEAYQLTTALTCSGPQLPTQVGSLSPEVSGSSPWGSRVGLQGENSPQCQPSQPLLPGTDTHTPTHQARVCSHTHIHTCKHTCTKRRAGKCRHRGTGTWTHTSHICTPADARAGTYTYRQARGNRHSLHTRAHIGGCKHMHINMHAVVYCVSLHGEASAHKHTCACLHIHALNPHVYPYGHTHTQTSRPWAHVCTSTYTGHIPALHMSTSIWETGSGRGSPLCQGILNNPAAVPPRSPRGLQKPESREDAGL